MAYFNRKVEEDGYVFASLREAERYCELRLLLAAGEISGLEVHPSWEIAPAVTLEGHRKRPIRYTADFSYRLPSGSLVVEDVKPRNGYRSRDYKIRRHMMKAVHGIEVREVM